MLIALCCTVNVFGLRTGHQRSSWFETLSRSECGQLLNLVLCVKLGFHVTTLQVSRRGVYPRTINPFQLTNILTLLSNRLVTCRGYSLILLLLQWARLIIGLINDVLFRAVRYGAALSFDTLGGCGHGLSKIAALLYIYISSNTVSLTVVDAPIVFPIQNSTRHTRLMASDT